jgi:predicted RND superfamily exporter protein
MVEAMAESSIAIFITSITDVFSFAIGCFTDILAVRGFCMMTSACMFFTFLYQTTFFAALMVVSAKTQMSQRNACMPCLRADDYYSDVTSDAQRFARRHNSKKSENRQKRLKKDVICAFDAKDGNISPATSNATSSVCSSSSSASDFNLRVKSRGVMGQFFR